MNIGHVEKIKQIQTELNRIGFRVDIDGIMGPDTLGKILTALTSIPTIEKKEPEVQLRKLCWGVKVSDDFKKRVIQIADKLLLPKEGADWLMACMAFESGRTFSANVRNKLSGGTGLIQFMPTTAGLLGTTTQELAGMTPLRQLDYVEKYLAPYKGRITNIDDLYMTILWPAAVGKPDAYPLWVNELRHPKAYIQNAGLDRNKDGIVEKREAASKVRDIHKEGLEDRNYG